MGKILAIDYGKKRVGLALSDALKITAQSIPTLDINGDNNILIEKIKKINEETCIDKIVIGYPKHLNGDKSESTLIVDEVIKLIEKEGFEVVKLDERLTTVMAHRTMRELGIKQKEKKTHADRLAAMYILEDYLSSLI